MGWHQMLGGAVVNSKFDNLGIRSKLFLLVGIALAVMGGIVFQSMVSIRSLNSTLSQFGDTRLPLTIDVGEIHAASHGIPRFLWLAVSLGQQEAGREKALGSVQHFVTVMDENVGKIEKVPMPASTREKVAAIVPKAAALKQIAEKGIQLINVKTDQGGLEAKKFLLQNLPEAAVPFTKSLEELLQEVEKDNSSLVDQAKTDSAKNLKYLVMTPIVLSVFFVFLGLMIASGLVRKFLGLSKEISSASQFVASSSSQLASASRSLADSASVQASSLQETAASLEEMNAMIQSNKDAVSQVNELTQKSRQSSDSGKHVVEQMGQAIEGISDSNQKIMEQVNLSNQQFSEIVKVIAEIGNKTKVINDIVFQTKLLSFNASVEAARAGEHGKGFAVVAEEVGNLAQMSGNAAKEISEMLDASIHKVQSIATETKSKVEVLIEEGKHRVETGISVVGQCREVLNSISGEVEKVAEMATSISSATQEQSNGVSEMAKAMSLLDNSTQQNSAAATESAAAVESLSAQAEQLKKLGVNFVAAVQGAGASVQVNSHSRPTLQTQKVSHQSSTKPARKSEKSVQAHHGTHKSAKVVDIKSHPKKVAKNHEPILASHSASSAPVRNIEPEKKVVGIEGVPTADDHRFEDL